MIHSYAAFDAYCHHHWSQLPLIFGVCHIIVPDEVLWWAARGQPTPGVVYYVGIGHPWSGQVTLVCLNSFSQMKHKYIITSSTLTEHMLKSSHGTQGPFLNCIFNTMAADVLETWVARTSAVMVLIWFANNIPASETDGFTLAVLRDFVDLSGYLGWYELIHKTHLMSLMAKGLATDKNCSKKGW